MKYRETMNPDVETMRRIQLGLLKDDRLCAQKINVEVDHDIVLLRGTVASFRRKLVAQQIVASFAGTRDVLNELEVEPLQPATDQEVADDARVSLNASADITKETIIVSCVNGVVALTGNVSSNWERVCAEDIVRGVRGVRDVTNMLTVNAIRAKDAKEVICKLQEAISRTIGLQEEVIHVAMGVDTVVLSGAVHAVWMRDAAETIVGGFGFLRIRNEIQIAA